MARLDYSDTFPIDPERLSSHLIAQGFTQKGASAWSRGGILGGWLGLSPKSWPVTVSVEGSTVRLSVRAGGQLLTRAEAEFWELEWSTLCAAASGRLVDTAVLARRRDVSFVENTLVTALPIPVAVVAGVIMGNLAGLWAGLAVGVGTVIGLFFLGALWLMKRR
jgi:hypothetical protein